MLKKLSDKRIDERARKSASELKMEVLFREEDQRELTSKPNLCEAEGGHANQPIKDNIPSPSRINTTSAPISKKLISHPFPSGVVGNGS